MVANNADLLKQKNRDALNKALSSKKNEPNKENLFNNIQDNTEKINSYIDGIYHIIFNNDIDNQYTVSILYTRVLY